MSSTNTNDPDAHPRVIVAAPRTNPTTAAGSNRLSTPMIICIVIAAVLMLVSFFITWLLLRERTRHRQQMADLEQRGIAAKDEKRARKDRWYASLRPTVPVKAVVKGDGQGSRTVLRKSVAGPFGSSKSRGWSGLSSKEDVVGQQKATTAVGEMSTEVFTRPFKKRKSRLSWAFGRQKAIPSATESEVELTMMGANRLSIIVEKPSPQTVTDRSALASQDVESPLSNQPSTSGATRPHASGGLSMAGQTIRRIDSMAELRPDPLTIGKKRARAQTMVPQSTTSPPTPRTEPAKGVKRVRPSIHMRSISLGSGSVPQGEAPPLPLFVADKMANMRPRSWIEGTVSPRMSMSSLDSVGSSLLIGSPKLNRSASEKSARLRNVVRKDYTLSLISGPRPVRQKVGKRPNSSPGHHTKVQSLKGSIRSTTDSLRSNEHHRRMNSSVAQHIDEDGLSLPGVKTAEAVRMSRVSLAPFSSPLLSTNTPRRQSRYTVSESGSPAQRVMSVSIKDIAPHSRLIRQLSNTSTGASSTRSSNGNPFQFDPSPMASGKPSAMKGSPNARPREQGHKRSQTVRIAVRPTAFIEPPQMGDIEEESPEQFAAKMYQQRKMVSSMGALPHPPSSPRPPSSPTFEPQLNVRPRSFVASLTPDSPTLSSMKFQQDNGSKEQGLFSFSTSSNARDAPSSRLSLSSIVIPTFPSPGKTMLTTNVMPTPTFSWTRPSDEFDRASSNAEGIMLLAKPIASPPVKFNGNTTPGTSAKVASQAKSWTDQFVFPQLEKEQLRASDPPFEEALRKTSSVFDLTEQEWSWPSKQHLQPMSPPCSPRTLPTIQQDVRTSESQETSTPADIRPLAPSRISLPLHSPSPILGLPNYSTTLLTPTEIDPPSTELRSSIAQLRRMNSDARHDAENPKLKGARRYQRMGRGESPVIELAGRDSMASMSDVDQVLAFGIEEVDDGEKGDGESFASFEYDVLDYECGAGGDNGAVEDDCDSDTDAEQAKATPRPDSLRVEETVDIDSDAFYNPTSRPNSSSISPLSSTTSLLPPGTRRVSPLSATNVQNRDNMGIQSPLPHRRVSEMRGSAILDKMNGMSTPGTPKVVVVPPSSESGTPVSLYDENGFLKGEGGFF